MNRARRAPKEEGSDTKEDIPRGPGKVKQGEKAGGG